MRAACVISILLVLPIVAASNPVPRSVNLLTAAEVDGQCSLAVWNPTSRSTRQLARLDECPEALFVSETQASVYFVEGGSIYQVRLRGDPRPELIADVPRLTLEKAAAEIFSRPLTDYEKMTASIVMRVRSVGVTSGGVLWVHLWLVMSGDDEYEFLFKRVDRQWVFDEFVHCGRFEVCGFKGLAGEESGRPDDALAPQLWDERISTNPYFLRDEALPSVDSGYRRLLVRDRIFDVDGKPVSLEVWNGSGPDTGNPYLAGAAIKYADGESIVICEQQCSASLTGQFLLAQRYWGGTLELYDIASGESVLGVLEHAIWLRIAEDPGP